MPIAGEVMPANLRPNNVNPFGDLYKLLSIGLHDRTDDECCEIVGAMDDSLKFIYTQLTTHMEASKAYEAGTGKVAALLAKMNLAARMLKDTIDAIDRLRGLATIWCTGIFQRRTQVVRLSMPASRVLDGSSGSYRLNFDRKAADSSLGLRRGAHGIDHATHHIQAPGGGRAGARGCGRRVSAPVWQRGTRS